MKRFVNLLFALAFLVLLSLAIPSRALAQEETPTPPDLTLTTTYPSQIVERGETVSIKLKVRAVGEAQTVQMDMKEIPEGWDATFRGGGRLINAVYVAADATETVELRLEQPENVESGTYTFVVLAQGEKRKAELLITLTIAEKLPASLRFSIDLPTIKGSPTTTFRFTPTLRNEGDEEITVNIMVDAPSGFLSKVKVSGKEVTSFPLNANQSKTVTIELDPLVEIPAGEYPVVVYADGGDVEASINLAVEVAGQQKLKITGLDGRLSGKANAGKETSMQIVVRNTGTAPARGVDLSASAPSGWKVVFDPETILEIPADSQVEVTAHIQPAEKAVAGDYMVTVRARPADGASESAEFRITVTTSTLWGVGGIALIAVAVGVVALAVVRFGRR